MELTTSIYQLAVVLAVASVDGSVNELNHELPEKGVLNLADMLQDYKTISKRSLKNESYLTEEELINEGYTDIKHCCGDPSVKYFDGREEHQKFKDVVDLMRRCDEQEEKKHPISKINVDSIDTQLSYEQMKLAIKRRQCIYHCVMKESGAVLQEKENILNAACVLRTLLSVHGGMCYCIVQNNIFLKVNLV
ncbi:unnamed protein product [Nezara viridula]|uniref:Uncharacterized protein n=1 Tax=Nezara viridula TaxID=85310 RepID=A0A9P0DWQ0_NEZVI|nr:unnamed protein product [Nezara viridula]